MHDRVHVHVHVRLWRPAQQTSRMIVSGACSERGGERETYRTVEHDQLKHLRWPRVVESKRKKRVDGRSWRALPHRPSLFAMKPGWTPVHSRMNQLRKWQLMAKRIRERQIATSALAVGEQCGNEPDAVVGIDVKECAICMEAICDTFFPSNCGHEFCGKNTQWEASQLTQA